MSSRRAALAAAVVAALVGVGVAVGAGGAPRLEGLVGRTGPSVAGPGAQPSLIPPATSAALAAWPPVRRDPLELSARRLADTATYARRHYGVASSRLDPRMVVLHFTEGDTYASTRALFAANLPSNGEAPGTCSHYVVDQDGTIYELVPPTVMCRHTIGLNHLAIGIEFVQSSRGHSTRWAAQQVLARPRQVGAGLALVRSLQRDYGIADRDVIGHAMANDAKGFHDLEGWRNDHVDWERPEVERFRAMLGQG